MSGGDSNLVFICFDESRLTIYVRHLRLCDIQPLNISPSREVLRDTLAVLFPGFAPGL